MKVAVSTIGRFHLFDLARQLKKRHYLSRLYTAYPHWKVDEDLRDDTKTFPWLNLLDHGLARFGWQYLRQKVNWYAHVGHDYWVSRQLDDADIVVCLSSDGLQTFHAAHRKGIKAVCDRGSTHMRVQEDILSEEYAKYGRKFGYEPRVMQRALEEYETADLIAVPSSFVRQTFLDQGTPTNKVAVIPYGVDVSLFKPVSKEDDVFRVIYVGAMSFRKGIPYLLEALATLDLPNFELVLVGGASEETKAIFERYEGNFRYLGFKPRTQLSYYYSQASVFVMASLEEGLALVQAQAMACGLPLIITPNTGGEDLITDGVEGFVVPIRNPEAIREKVLYLYENPDVRDRMAQAALERVQSLGGWNDYGQQAIDAYQKLLKNDSRIQDSRMSS